MILWNLPEGLSTMMSSPWRGGWEIVGHDLLASTSSFNGCSVDLQKLLWVGGSTVAFDISWLEVSRPVDVL